MTGKGALETSQRPENQVEVPEGEENETSSLVTREMVAGKGHWKQVRVQKTRWKSPKEKGMRPVPCLPEKMVAGKGALEAGQRPQYQVEDPEEKGEETSALFT